MGDKGFRRIDEWESRQEDERRRRDERERFVAQNPAIRQPAGSVAELHVELSEPIGACYLCGADMTVTGVDDLMLEPDPHQSFAALRLDCSRETCSATTWLHISGHDAEWLDDTRARAETYRQLYASAPTDQYRQAFKEWLRGPQANPHGS